MNVFGSRLVLACLGAFALGACADGDLPQEPVEDAPDSPQFNAASRTIITYDDRLAAIDVDGFAGLYVDGAGRAVVRSIRPDPDLGRLADAVSATLAAGQQVAPPGITNAVIEPAQFTFKELFEWKRAVGTQLGEGAIVTLDANERTNRVEIGVLPGTDIEELRSRVVRLGVPADAISVVERHAVQFDQTLRDKVRDTVGGLRLVGPGACTLGFNANWGAERVLVTNSHCTFGQGGVQSGEFFQPNIDTGGPAAFGPWEPSGAGSDRTSERSLRQQVWDRSRSAPRHRGGRSWERKRCSRDKWPTVWELPQRMWTSRPHQASWYCALRRTTRPPMVVTAVPPFSGSWAPIQLASPEFIGDAM